MNSYSLCATGVWAYIPDILAGVFALIMVFISARKGFIGCVLGIVSSIVAIILAISLSGVIVDATGGLFGLQESLSGVFEKAFASKEGFNVDVSSQEALVEALKSENVSAIIARLVLNTNEQEFAAGTTLAMLVGDAMGSLAARLIAGIVLFILIKIVVRLLKNILSGVLEKAPLLGGVNRLLGGVFGLVYAWFVISALLAVLAILPMGGVTTFLESTAFVGWMYDHNILVIVLSWFL